MKFIKINSTEWWSEDLKYRVWLQGRLLNGEKEWAAQCIGEPKWLCSAAPSRSTAQEYCKAHAAKTKATAK